MKKSCWGCGNDYKTVYLPELPCTDDLLSPIIIEGENTFICPDCYYEMSEEGEIDETAILGKR